MADRRREFLEIHDYWTDFFTDANASLDIIFTAFSDDGIEPALFEKMDRWFTKYENPKREPTLMDILFFDACIEANRSISERAGNNRGLIFGGVVFYSYHQCIATVAREVNRLIWSSGYYCVTGKQDRSSFSFDHLSDAIRTDHGWILEATGENLESKIEYEFANIADSHFFEDEISCGLNYLRFEPELQSSRQDAITQDNMRPTAIESHPDYDAEKQKALEYKNAGHSVRDVKEAADAGLIKYKYDVIKGYADLTGQTVLRKRPGRPS